MKRMLCILLILSLLTGCGLQVVKPQSTAEKISVAAVTSAPPTTTVTEAPATPEPTATLRPTLATFAPLADPEPLFPEEALSQDGEPIASLVRSLLEEEGLSKAAFLERFLKIIDRMDALDAAFLRLSGQGRTLTADRQEKTVDALMQLMSQETQAALQAAYSNGTGAGEDLPLERYAASMDELIRDVQGMEGRTCTFFELGTQAARAYKTALERFMGESIVPLTLFHALEELMETEAYAINAALRADPEAARKKEAISLGSFQQNIRFLIEITQEICPLPDGARLPMLTAYEGGEDMSIMELAFHYYPGMAFLRAYAARGDGVHQARWASAPDGYLAGLAVHGSYAVTACLDRFGVDYVRYRWYEDMLDVTMTGMCALLIHYYGYSTADLAEYLKSWGAESFVGYLYGKAMSDPFESLVAAYGYWQYLDICQAVLDAGCSDERSFLQDYLAVGPAPYEPLKEYMVAKYQNEG